MSQDLNKKDTAIQIWGKSIPGKGDHWYESSETPPDFCVMRQTLSIMVPYLPCHCLVTKTKKLVM